MELVDASLVQINVEADDWEDAIFKSASPLVNKGIITEEYPKRVVEIAKESGPYIVITPHIALSHAGVKDGALKDAIGFTVLKKAVKFGNESNDPVKYIFTLSSTLEGGHLAQMARLVEILQRGNFETEIEACTTNEKVSEYFNN